MFRQSEKGIAANKPLARRLVSRNTIAQICAFWVWGTAAVLPNAWLNNRTWKAIVERRERAHLFWRFATIFNFHEEETLLQIYSIFEVLCCVELWSFDKRYGKINEGHVGTNHCRLASFAHWGSSKTVFVTSSKRKFHFCTLFMSARP